MIAHAAGCPTAAILHLGPERPPEEALSGHRRHRKTGWVWSGIDRQWLETGLERHAS